MTSSPNPDLASRQLRRDCRLKILLLVESSLGGVGNHITSLAEEFWRRGHDVHLVYSHLRADRLFNRRIQHLTENCPGLKLFPASIQRLPGWSDAGTLATIRRYCRASGPFDVIHAHSTKAGFLARLALRNCCAALVYTPHAPLTMKPELSFVGRSAVRIMETLLALRTNALVAICSDERDHLTRLGISSRRVSVIESGIVRGSPVTRTDRMKMRASLGIRDSDQCIGYVGRFDSQKKPDILLQAFHSLLLRRVGTRSSVRLVMAGFGPWLARLKSEAEKLNVADQVIWPGEIDGRSAMAAFDILALTSDYEVLPYCLLEALSTGLPIVTTAVSGASSVVLDGENGFIVPRRQPDAFAAALDRILSDPELREQMGAASRKRSEHFTLDRMVDEIEALYWREAGVSQANPERWPQPLKARP